MAASLVYYLERFKEREGRPLKMGIYYKGGTIFCVPDPKGELTPIKKTKTIEEIVMEDMYYGKLADAGLIELDFINVGPMDSSQMDFIHRDTIVNAISKRHMKEDGGIVLHGTDSGADTSSYLGLAAPYSNPIKLWNARKYMEKTPTREELVQYRNITNPYLTASSQFPIPDKHRPINLGSDGVMNLELGIIAAASRELGGAHYLTNFFIVENGFWCEKQSDSEFSPYKRDTLTDPEAMLTGFGLVKLDKERLTPSGNTNDALFVTDAGKFENLVSVVNEGSHLATVKAMEDAIEKGYSEVSQYLHLPRIILYVSKGAGNVRQTDYGLLEFARKRRAFVARVPLHGGRVPVKNEFGQQQHFYAVPGKDIPALNLTSVVAKQKAAITLALANTCQIPTNQFEEFITFMMNVPWNGREFLPINSSR
ncbi:asparaginase [Candidatus Woesearchaeota archaeon]|nr:asparaginase [Candidatus Woesearchaeota archaeon]